MAGKEIIKLLTPEQFLALPPNKRLLAVKEQIEFAPEHHDQSWWFRYGDNWRCDTTACVAGTAAVLAGWVEVDGHDRVRRRVACGAPRRYRGDWRRMGQELLGLTDAQADTLFHDTETADVLKVIDRILEENA